MLTKRIIPCLDVDQGRVVKGKNFINLVDAGDPVALAKFYDEQGADELCFLDITASSDARDTVVEMVERVAREVFIPFAVGGGIRSVTDARRILAAGADKVAVNSAAVARPELIRELADALGSQNVVLAIDAKRVNSKQQTANSSPSLSPNTITTWHVFVKGGREDTGLDAVAWAKQGAALGAGEILLTSMDADGVKGGFDVPLTRAIAEAVQISVIASGGAGNATHFREAFEAGADAGLAASIFHFKETSIRAIKQELTAQGVSVRM